MAQAARYALGIRYSLLPYLYTSFRNTASHGCPLARALMLGWPWDLSAKAVDRQWTMGDAVLITPVMEEVAHCFKRNGICWLLAWPVQWDTTSVVSSTDNGRCCAHQPRRTADSLLLCTADDGCYRSNDHVRV